MSERSDITLTINGRLTPFAVEPRRTLADAIREDCGQTGTHIGCEHGVCGACTVLVDGEPVRSCLMFAVQADGKEIRTVEGLANGDELHPMQHAFMDHHGLQCGFCTPGFLMLISRRAGARARLSATRICSTCCRPISAAAPAIRTSSRPCVGRRRLRQRKERRAGSEQRDRRPWQNKICRPVACRAWRIGRC